MRMMFGLVLLVGMALAGFAVYMAQGYINQTESALNQERAFRAKVGDLVEVYVAAEQLKYGDTLAPDEGRRKIEGRLAVSARGALEQAHPQAVLQLANQHTHGRWGDEHLRGGCTQLAQPVNRHEGLQLAHRGRVSLIHEVILRMLLKISIYTRMAMRWNAQLAASPREPGSP